MPKVTVAWKIRPAEARDADGLAAVYLDSARHHTAIDPSVHEVPENGEAVERMRAKLRDDSAAMFVAEEAGAVIGLLQIQIVRHLHQARSCGRCQARRSESPSGRTSEATVLEPPSCSSPSAGPSTTAARE